jgi:hypothetical protein
MVQIDNQPSSPSRPKWPNFWEKNAKKITWSLMLLLTWASIYYYMSSNPSTGKTRVPQDATAPAEKSSGSPYDVDLTPTGQSHPGETHQDTIEENNQKKDAAPAPVPWVVREADLDDINQ